MTDDLAGNGTSDPTPSGSAGGSNPPRSSAGSSSTVVYTGHEGKRYGALEIEVGDETWTFPKGREVKDVPQPVVDALEELDGDHDFKITKGA